MPRALVIGSVLDGIHGVENDVEKIAALLRKRHFKIRRCEHRDASRAGILAACKQLIHQVKPGSDEPVVIYYAGHGGLVINKAPADGDILPPVFQCLVPTDWARSTDDDFRGISSFELSLLLRQLAARTRNVTVILDCCYAGQAVDPHVADKRRARSLLAPSTLMMVRHMAYLKRVYGSAMHQPVPINRSVVSVVACGQQDPAWPVRDGKGNWFGAMTLALLEVLGEVGTARVSWASIITAVRRRVRDKLPDQRPDVEGPANRRAFSLAEVTSGPIEIEQDRERFVLGAGQLAGVAVGDLYVASPLADPDREVAEVRVTQTTPLSAEAALVAWRSGFTALPSDAIAVVRKHALARKPVRVVCDSLEAEQAIVHAIERTQRLRVASPADSYPIATIEQHGRTVGLADELGPLLAGRAFPDDLTHVLAVASNLAAARQLLDLEGEHGIPSSDLVIRWGLLEHASRPDVRIPSVETSQRIFIEIKNTNRGARHVHVFNIDPAGTIVALSSAAPSGFQVKHDQEVTLGRASDGQLVGIPLSWPPGVPTTRPRPGCLLIIATAQPSDLGVIETSHQAMPDDSPRSALQRLLRQVYTGALRAEDDEVDPYLMRPLTYVLHAPRSADARDAEPT